MDDLIEKIANELIDYRLEDKHLIKRENIVIWINQFKEDDRVFILEEMLNIFKCRYCTKNDAIEFLKDTIEKLTKYFNYVNTTAFLNETALLSLQKMGKSQTKILKLLKDILITNYAYNYDDRNVKTIKNYLYIDDILCTGNTLYQDINKWLNENFDGKTRYQDIEEKGSRLIFAYIFIYQKNYWKKIGLLKRNFNQRITNYITLFRWIEIDNNSNKPTSKCEIVKPIEQGLSEKSINYKDQICKSVDAYVGGKYDTEEDFFRPTNIPFQEELFTSKENRTRLERIFLEKGIEILENTETVSKQQMRALGYSLPSYKDFGFGALCFTWRNIPNNTPLVFWYAGGGFVPLFDKNIYEQDVDARIAAKLNKK